MKEDYFKEFGLIEPLRQAIREEGFRVPTPIQKQAIPRILEGRDLFGCAQTGSGKTAAFVLPILNRLAKTQKNPVRNSTRTLVLAPTRELAAQIGDSFSIFGRYLHLRHAVVHGGVSRREQIRKISSGVDILVATPGRLLDLMDGARGLLGRVEIVVLDEADRMLDMGFIPDIMKVLQVLPARRQTLFFSATMPPSVISLAANMLLNPHHVEIASNADTEPQIEQKVLFVNSTDKNALLMKLLSGEGILKVLVFTRTKHRARDLSRHLTRLRVRSDDLHSDKTQEARKKALEGFHSGKIRVLVATDIAARGIDVDDIDHVINYELPNEPENYIHRIGRTARAGKTGTALSFCDASEIGYLKQIERVLKKQLPVWKDQPFHSVKVQAGKSSGKMSKGGKKRPHVPASRKRSRKRSGYRHASALKTTYSR
jgi:ATP-dependent RNA helicase RhlE